MPSVKSKWLINALIVMERMIKVKQINVLLCKAVVDMHFINIASEIVFKQQAKEEIHKENVLCANWYGKYKMNKK